MDLRTTTIDWLEQVPTDWKELKIKHLFKHRVEKVSDKIYPPLSVTMKGIVPQLDNVAKSDNSNDRKKVCIGDFVINSRSDRKGSSGSSDYEGSVSLINTVLEPRGIESKYVEYLFKSKEFIEEFFRNGRGIHWDLWSTNYSRMANIKVPVPPKGYQLKAIEYLESKLNSIDELTIQLEKKVWLLKEKRTSLINLAVTKGLDPNLDMKDSGVDWIGDIPKHWQTIKFKFGTDLMTCGHAATPEYVEDYKGEIFLSAQNIKNEKVDFKKHNYISTDLHKMLTKHHKVEYGDVLQVRVGGKSNIGQTAVYESEKEISIYVSLSHIKLNHRFSAHFIKYLCNSSRYKEEASVLMKQGGGVANFNVSDQEKIKIPYPPISEQQQIVEFLDEQTQGIDKTVSNEEEKIKLLKEYRQSLISSVVTGKIKVTEDA